MNLVKISLAYLRARKLGTALDITLLAFGVAAVTLLLLTTHQVQQRIERDRRGIDLVVGAKGSPMQIVMSTVYQLDVPTGSIPWPVARDIIALPPLGKAIPLALADNYFGYRIVGTTPDYVAHYGASLTSGRLWKAPSEAVLGADMAARSGLGIGASFAAAHGLGRSGVRVHDDPPYRVVGVLGRTGTVLDQLVLTSLESVWSLHRVQPTPSSDGRTGDPREITAVMIKYGTAAAAPSIMTIVNGDPRLQAASPLFETVRLLDIIGVGLDVLRAFAFVLVLSAALAVFIGLYHALNERRYDLAIMRALGASRERIMVLLLFEGVLLAAIGAAVGVVLGHVLTSVLGFALRQAQQIPVTGWTWDYRELWIVMLALAVGLVASLVPAWRAHDMDIAGTLARR